MADALGTYRGQNGIKIAGGYDPQVVDWIRQAAAETGADPAALLATSLMENGARLGGKPGDNGTSFGPFQFHIGGALGSHSPAWASTYPAVLNRAQEFARLKVHGGVGAAAVQRPLDRSTYAAGVNGLLARANAILGRTPSGARTVPAQTPGAAQTTLSQPLAAPDPYATIDFINALLGDSSIERLQSLGTRLQQAQAAKRTPSSQPAGPPPSATGSSPNPVTTSPDATAPTRTSGGYTVGNFEGTKVAAWMVPALQYARQKGWKGHLTSGLRSTDLQRTLYARYQAGGAIAAKPGQSNHEIQNGGAFDATDAQQLYEILKSFNGKRPIYAPTVGLRDSVHFSLNGH